jgi:prepilin peptidase CpaA
MLITLIVHGVLILLTVVAAVIDWRTGHIPNWLTVPPIVIGPLFWLGVDLALGRGLFMFYQSVIGMVACTAVPLLLWWKKGMGGGDVKLFAGIGAIATLNLGIETQFLALLACGLFSLARLAWQGKLLRTFGNAFYISVNPVLPQKWRKEISPELLTMVRFGPAIATGAALAVLDVYGRLWL